MFENGEEGFWADVHELYAVSKYIQSDVGMSCIIHKRGIKMEYLKVNDRTYMAKTPLLPSGHNAARMAAIFHIVGGYDVPAFMQNLHKVIRGDARRLGTDRLNSLSELALIDVVANNASVVQKK